MKDNIKSNGLKVDMNKMQLSSFEKTAMFY